MLLFFRDRQEAVVVKNLGCKQLRRGRMPKLASLLRFMSLCRSLLFYTKGTLFRKNLIKHLKNQLYNVLQTPVELEKQINKKTREIIIFLQRTPSAKILACLDFYRNSLVHRADVSINILNYFIDAGSNSLLQLKIHLQA